ncbi:MAG TPA: tetratricopeptide repeat protein, partial [Flavobacteriales bacterium]|nr:tetratricopeptide repeat protein [Flavobacteriales bacterium]
MKKLFLLLTFAFAGISLHAQTSPNALWKIVGNQKKADTARVNALYNISINLPYFDVYNDSTIFFAEKAAIFAESKKLQVGLISTQHIQAFHYLRKGDHKKSMSMAQNALMLVDQAHKQTPGDSKITGLETCLHIVLSLIYKKLENNHEALKEYETIYTLASSINAQRIAASALNSQASIYFNNGNSPLALDYLKRSIELHTLCGFKKGVMQATNTMGLVYNSMNDQPKAIEAYTKAIEIAREIGAKKSLAQYQANTASIYYALGNYEKAKQLYAQCLNTGIELKDKQMVSYAYGNLSMVYYFLWNDLKENEGHPDSIVALEEKLLFAAEKNVSLKEEMGVKSSMPNAYNTLSQTYYETKGFSKAIVYAKKSLAVSTEIGSKKEMAMAYNTMGNFYLMHNDLDSAETSGLKALELARETSYQTQLDFALDLLARIKEKQKKYAEAEKYAVETLEHNNKIVDNNFIILSEKEKELYLNTLYDEYATFHRIALAGNTENPAIVEMVYNTTLKNKGVLLKSSTAMRNAILNANDPGLTTLYNEWTDIKKQMGAAYANGADAKAMEEKANELEKQLVQKSQVFNEYDKSTATTWKDIQQKLKPGEAAIEFIHFDNSTNQQVHDAKLYCALVVKPGGKYPEMIPLCDEKSLVNILGNFGGNNLAYINGIYTYTNEQKAGLYNLVWKPLEKSLAKTKTVYLSPSGLLHKISFAAIGKDKSTFLCDKYLINILSSTSKLVSPADPGFSASMSTALFGGINYNSDSSSVNMWKFLEGTKNETAQVRSLLEESKHVNKVFTGDAATEEEFKKAAQNNQVLHIATHGFFYPDPATLKKASIKDEQIASINFRGSSGSFGIENFVENTNPLMRSGLVFAHA